MTATSKRSFTVGNGTWTSLKKLTGDKTSRGFAPLLSRPGIRFSRDRYLSELLDGELPRLKALPVNSEAAHRLLATEARDTRRNDPKSFGKANLNLATDVAREFTEIARAKRIPRDLLMGSFLELVVQGLSRARDIALDPTREEWSRDVNEEPYRDLYLSADDLEERRAAELAIHAIAKIKGIGSSSVRSAYWKLSRSKRRELRSRPRVRAEIKKLKKHWKRWEDVPVDLSDLVGATAPSGRRR